MNRTHRGAAAIDFITGGQYVHLLDSLTGEGLLGSLAYPLYVRTVAPDISAEARTSIVARVTGIGTGAAVTVLSANDARISYTIVNVGASIIRLLEGDQTPTATLYTYPIAGGDALDDGNGGSWQSSTWKGAVRVISSAAAGALIVTEYTP